MRLGVLSAIFDRSQALHTDGDSVFLRTAWRLLLVLALAAIVARPGYLTSETLDPALVNGADGFSKTCHYFVFGLRSAIQLRPMSVDRDAVRAEHCSRHMRWIPG